VNNDRLRHILQQLADPHGNLDPATVVDAATPATSPLHDYFTWDDGEAADKWRIDEARQLIRRVRITVIPQPDTPPIRVRAFMTVPAGRTVTCQVCGTQLRYYAWADTTRTTITCRRCRDLTCDAV